MPGKGRADDAPPDAGSDDDGSTDVGDKSDDNGDDARVDVAHEADAGTPSDPAVTDASTGSADASVPFVAWKPGDKIPAEQFWKSGTDGLSRDWAKSFGDWRGRSTSSSWIPMQFLDWDWITAPGLLSSVSGEEQTMVWDAWANFDGPVALAMSMAGNAEVDLAVYDKQMKDCATGAYDTYWKTFAKNAKAAGRNGSNTIVSLAQELNGTWFPWNPGRTSMDTWMSCWKHTYSAIHSESDLQVAWVFSATSETTVNENYAVASAWDAWPGDDYVDVLGVTRYDFKMLALEGSTDWNDTCWNDQDICRAAQLAREHKKKLAVVEWSIERTDEGYGDNPNFVQMMFGFFADNRDVLLLENNFSNYGEGDWNLYPRQDNNAKSSDKYVELYKR